MCIRDRTSYCATAIYQHQKIKIMTYKEANNISIKDYLNSLGIQPVTEKGNYGMYRSPLREDNTPSFKVDYNANLWCDYGTGEGGTLIDLVMKQHGCNAYGAICRLEQGNTASFSFHGKDLPERDTKRQAASPIEIRQIQPLQNPALMRYLQERGISPGTAAPYLSLIHSSDYADITVRRYDNCLKYLMELVKRDYKVDDMLLREVNGELVRKDVYKRQL